MRESYLFKHCFLIAIVITVFLALVVMLFNKGPALFGGESEQLDQATQEYLIEAVELVQDGAEDIKYNAKFVKSGKEYMDDALFIGDSRTVGLDYYGYFDNADFFSNVGMSIWNLPKTQVQVGDKGTYYLDDLLAKYKYGKIYLMMGINELGGDLKEIEQAYKKLVEKIHKLNPDAIIFISANLHVTKAKSDSDQRINNAALESVNMRQRSIADNRRIFYINPNDIFDDENGALTIDLTGDGVHPYASCYKDWCDWLLTKTVKVAKK
ncbi:MAG: GDSL-type esterase/lipase family protein [Clostridia bacterium]|nr:GDSL-type esterase/lipase family protein [Clostridia bacterium]